MMLLLQKIMRPKECQRPVTMMMKMMMLTLKEGTAQLQALAKQRGKRMEMISVIEHLLAQQKLLPTTSAMEDQTQTMTKRSVRPVMRCIHIQWTLTKWTM